MDNPLSPGGGDDDAPSLGGGFRYGIGVSVSVLTLILIITLLSYYFTRTRLDSSDDGRGGAITIAIHGRDSPEEQAAGLDDAALRGFPKLLYSDAKLHRGGAGADRSPGSASSCAICLADYDDADMLRLLPDCGHLFHLECVDSWLRRRPTCPVCRSSPLPTPLTTPLAEVTPLASADAAAGRRE